MTNLTKAAPISQTELWTKNFISILLVYFFFSMSFQLLLPTMPIYIKQLGVTEDILGIYIGIFTIITVLFRPVAGWAIDTKSRKGTYCLGLIALAASVLAYRFVHIIGLLFVLRLVHGISWGITTTSARTIAADAIPKSRLNEGMGFYGLIKIIAMIIAPTIAFQLIEKGNFDNLFSTSAFLIVIAVFFAARLTYLPIPPSAKAKHFFHYPLFEKEAYKPAGIIFFITFTYSAVMNFIGLFAAELEITGISLFYTILALTQLLSRPLSGRAADKYGPHFSIIPGIICIGFTMVILHLSHSLFFFLIAAVVYGIGYGSVLPALQAMTVSNIPLQRRGAANATFLSGHDLGIGIGSIVWGTTIKIFGYHTMYLLAIIPAIIAFILYLKLSCGESRLQN